MRKIICSLIIVFVLVGCGSAPPKLTREQWNELTTKKYKISEKEADKTIEKFFNLLDPSDVTFHYVRNGILVTRDYSIYMVIGGEKGTFFFDFMFEEDKKLNETKVSVGISYSLARIPIEEPAIYKLFWSRFDYLIKESNIWISCKDAEKLDIRKKLGNGSLNPICLNADDLLPEGVPKPEVKRWGGY